MSTECRIYACQITSLALSSSIIRKCYQLSSGKNCQHSGRQHSFIKIYLVAGKLNFGCAAKNHGMSLLMLPQAQRFSVPLMVSVSAECRYMLVKSHPWQKQRKSHNMPSTSCLRLKDFGSPRCYRCHPNVGYMLVKSHPWHDRHSRAGSYTDVIS